MKPGAATIKWDDLSRLWQQGKWAHVYLFAGQEDFLIEQALARLMTQWLADDTSEGLNRDRFDANTHKPSQILDAAQTMPFLSPTRVIQVDQAADFTAEEQKQLAEGLANLSPQTRIVFIWGREWKGKDASSHLVQAVGVLQPPVIFWPLFPEPARTWLMARAKHYQKSLSSDAATWLLHEAGEGLRQLDQELQKCALFVGGRPEIELEDVQASFGYGKASSPYEWLDAVRRKNAPQAMAILRDLLEEGEEPIRLLAMLSRAMRDWLTAHHPRETASSLAMRFHVRRGQENAFYQELKRWSEEDLADGFQRCVLAESRIKSGRETPEIALTGVCLGFFGAEAGYFTS
jgi:DNA polymerase-3 subunit delta